ncbi:Aste57867_10512 [Aphanomyces stellatus]|uniref:Aste57867_10512 protein n=1 Tax=Aphanomyces stellatus TaxID=120398 RepID=A0A485KQJ5_9STRA|nr:hypothetical protein As57867_010472 [Aphanomyces stellatus]VFT87385.1 Aste57867_10512 [Aphanomyces stellatus]
MCEESVALISWGAATSFACSILTHPHVACQHLFLVTRSVGACCCRRAQVVVLQEDIRILAFPGYLGETRRYFLPLVLSLVVELRVESVSPPTAQMMQAARNFRTFSTKSNALRFLIVDGYSPEGRSDLIKGGVNLASDLFKKMLAASANGIPTTHDVLFPSDGPFQAPDLSQYDAVAWTGCSLTVHDTADERVTRQLDLAKQCFAYGIPQYGSCWAAQIAVVAAGGVVSKNPRGREMGVARKISLTPEGRAHPLYEGKPSVFDAFTSHYDEITHVRPGSLVLSGNAFTTVQAVAVRHLNGEFWGVQYHPEYDLRDIARLIYARKERLVKYGIFASNEAADKFVAEVEELHEDPSRKDIAWRLGFDADVMDESVRFTETRNFIKHLVLPYKLKQILK